MRLPSLLLVAAGLAALAVPAHAAMYKCVTPDGTVLFQARPCAVGDRQLAVSGSMGPAEAGNSADAPRRKIADSDPRSPSVPSPRGSEERAVMDRDLAQRRDRCRVARETVERQKALLGSTNEVTRQQAGNEIKNQERRMREDGCQAV